MSAASCFWLPVEATVPYYYLRASMSWSSSRTTLCYVADIKPQLLLLLISIFLTILLPPGLLGSIVVMIFMALTMAALSTGGVGVCLVS